MCFVQTHGLDGLAPLFPFARTPFNHHTEGWPGLAPEFKCLEDEHPTNKQLVNSHFRDSELATRGCNASGLGHAMPCAKREAELENVLPPSSTQRRDGRWSRNFDENSQS